MKNAAFWDWFERVRPMLAGRAETFAKMFEYLDQFDRPVLIYETGCNRRDPAEEESWKGDGCSTILFDSYVLMRDAKGFVNSVDLDERTVAICNANTSWRTNVFTGDSVEFLKFIADGPQADLIYLDSFDFDVRNPLPSAIHHHRELMAAMPIIRDDTLVAIDDSPASFDENSHAEIGGKGFLVARHMLLVGADMAFAKYQAGWTRVRATRPEGDEDLRELSERALAHFEADDAVAAEQLYRLILGMTTPPKTGQARVAHGEACAFYARLAIARQKFGAAADWYREAISVDPHATDFRLELVMRCFLPMSALKPALTEAERAARLSPDYPKVWKALGAVHVELGNAAKAIDAYERQLALDPTDPDAMLDRASIALEVADLDTADRLVSACTGGDRHADAVHCMGMIAYREHHHEDAISLYREAIELGCRDPATARWNMSLALHAIGRYREGWVEHEHRAHNRASPALYLPMTRFRHLARWTGEGPMDIPENRMLADGSPDPDRATPVLIHVHYEAGAGDNLACARYLRELRERGYRVRYECADEMVDLMRTSFPDIEITRKSPDYPGTLGVRPFDYHIPMGSLPAVFETEVDTVPWRGPYLKADPILVDKYRAALKRLPHERSIGLVWSSGIRDTGIWITEYGKRKSMPFETAAEIMDAALDVNANLVALQIGPERAQMTDSIDNGWIYDVLPERPSWAETAALIANLDLVITVDTGVAHLAGAMGKPTWVMCQRDGASWHFLCWRPGAAWNERSPWYPATRVFRQHEFDRPHYWDDVVSDIANELRGEFGRQRAAE